ncbi:DUF892 family protein [Sphingomonas sp. Y38-1Y]|uniref:DUF892 family protein n=1 Tax=Sphingomonas sp. Y38-1Y TaxID=3078265 RepID=UPI0028F029EA|nr:DUF892 family protein [Sphingomonas sp. Y38-1Y]
MDKTDDAESLLATALQDMLAGERLLAERLPVVAAHARTAALSEALDREIARARLQADWLAADARSAGGPPNLWMQGIMDDAARDTETIDGGPLLDAAMVGAVRKALAAKHVSYETAVALAERLEEADLAKTLRRCRDEEAASDHRLAAILEQCAAAAA